MDSDGTLSGSLVLDKHNISEKCANFTLFFAEKGAKGEITPKALTDYLREEFTEEERIYLSLMFLAEKAQMLIEARTMYDAERFRPKDSNH